MLYRRKNSPFWQVEFYHEDERVRMSTGEKNKRTAEKKAAELQLTYSPSRGPKSPLESLKDRYLVYSTSHHSKSVRSLYKLILDRFCEFAGDKDLDPLLIEDYKEKRLLIVQKATVNRELTAIRSMFNMGVTWGLVNENPCEGVKPYRVRLDRKEIEFFSKAQVNLILHKSQESYLHDMILLAVYTGLRRMELVYLEWPDLNFQTWTLIVQAKDDLEWEPKGGRMRVLPIPRPCRQMLRERKAKSLSNFVFANELGRPRFNNLSRDLRELLKRIKVYRRSMGWHTFRHTYASHLVMQGKPLNTVGDLLGHADPKTTKIYAHLSPEHFREVTDELDFGIEKVREIGRNDV